MRGGEATSVPISKDTKRFNAQQQKGHWNYHNPFQISDQQAQNPKFPTFDWTGIFFLLSRLTRERKRTHQEEWNRGGWERDRIGIVIWRFCQVGLVGNMCPSECRDHLLLLWLLPIYLLLLLLLLSLACCRCSSFSLPCLLLRQISARRKKQWDNKAKCPWIIILLYIHDVVSLSLRTIYPFTSQQTYIKDRTWDSLIVLKILIQTL